MAKANLIAPFPTDINREAFGHWLSGFTDGEGCFMLGIHNRNWQGYHGLVPFANFIIGLRADDEAVLRLIQSYFQCGILDYRPRSNNNGKPQFVLRVRNIPELSNIVVPHFDRFPLYAKKKRDFLIWREAVMLFSEIMKRPYRRRTHGRGMSPKWTAEERSHFKRLHDSLREQRAYNSAPIITETLLSKAPERNLFD